MENIRQQEVWNNIAEKWNSYRKKPSSEIIEFLKAKKGKILDLGCGSGRNLIPNKNTGYYCVDFSEEMLKFARENTKKQGIKAEFAQVDIGRENLPFEDEFFDSAIYISTLHCIESIEERKKSLNELYRVMKKGAIGMITAWKKESTEKLKNIQGKELSVGWKKGSDNYPRFYYFYDAEELESLLKETGFKIIKKKLQDSKTLIGMHARKNFIFYVKK